MLPPFRLRLPNGAVECPLMKRVLPLVALVGWVSSSTLLGQTDGSAWLQVSLLDYNGSGTKHFTVVWVTTQSGTFIKSLRKQGPSSWTSKEWNDHCRAWNDARAGSTALDGYTSATATTYSGTNSPVKVEWDGRDAAGRLMPDGNYKFWVQYAEDSGQGPYTISGLLWTKGPAASTNTYPNQGANFANLRVTWAPSAPSLVAPAFSSLPPPATGTVGVPYSFLCSATGTAPMIFSAQSLPPGLTISSTGLLSGTPLQPGTFVGTIVAANGIPPNATQAFSIDITAVPARFTSVRADGTNLVLTATGPPAGVCAVLILTHGVRSGAPWTPLATNSFGAAGTLALTNTLNRGLPQAFYQLRVP